MKSYVHLADKIFRQPWLVKPSTHQTIARQFIAHVTKSKVALPDSDQDEPTKPDLPAPSIPSLAVISVDGIIGKHIGALESLCGGYDIDTLASQLKAARDNADVQAILLYINSPGGTAVGVSEVGELIADIDANYKPVFAFTDTQACSGAYWLASQCRAIYCAPSADVGSVGVYMTLLDETESLAMDGLKINAISAGTFKLSGASFKPLTEDERAMFQDGVNRIYTKFKAAVTSKRTIEDANLQGQVFDGEQAVSNGMVDGLVNDLDGAVEVVKASLPNSVLTA